MSVWLIVVLVRDLLSLSLLFILDGRGVVPVILVVILVNVLPTQRETASGIQHSVAIFQSVTPVVPHHFVANQMAVVEPVQMPMMARLAYLLLPPRVFLASLCDLTLMVRSQFPGPL